LAVVCSASGLWFLAFSVNPVMRTLGLALLVAPHAIGAPQPAIQGGTVPAAMGDEFIRATCVANAALWLSAGGLLGMFFRVESQR
jgi:predicted cobalt transporter CbtA